MEGTLSAGNRYILQLIRGSLNGTTPPEKPEGVTWQELYHEAKRNSVLSIAYDGMMRLHTKPDTQELAIWKHSVKKRMVSYINQSVECENLIRRFSENQLRMLPVKGYWLRRMYPRPELREMADIDILVDDDRSEKTKALMQELGFECEGSNCRHTSYRKGTYVNIELHRQLLLEDSAFAELFNDPWSRTSGAPDNPYIRCLTWEDFYLFLIAHFVKHYRGFGCGIRHIVDIFVFLRAHQQTLDWQSLNRELAKQELTEFSDTARALAETWFANGVSDDKQREMARKLFVSGSYGTKDMYYANRIAELTPTGKSERVGRRRFFLRIVFPPREEMALGYPVLNKVGVLLPICWLLRGIRSVCRPGRIKAQVNRVMKQEKQK